MAQREPDTRQIKEPLTRAVPSLVLKLTSDPKEVPGARRAVESFAAEAGFGQAEMEFIGLCVNEALANIIRHAYHDAPGRPIELRAVFIDSTLRITLRDWGNGRTPEPPPESASELWTPGGLGLTCMRRTMDDVIFSPQHDGMLLTLTKART